MLLLFKQYHIYGFFLKIDGENDNDSFDITAVDMLTPVGISFVDITDLKKRQKYPNILLTSL